LFGQLLDTVKTDVTRVLMNVRVQSPEQVSEAAQQMENRAEQIANVTYSAPNGSGEPEVVGDSGDAVAQVPRVGRNDPCPCGSGKKYKQCHGKLA
jgi:preprotein translocase subunit SecA